MEKSPNTLGTQKMSLTISQWREASDSEGHQKGENRNTPSEYLPLFIDYSKNLDTSFSWTKSFWN